MHSVLLFWYLYKLWLTGREGLIFLTLPMYKNCNKEIIQFNLNEMELVEDVTMAKLDQ